MRIIAYHRVSTTKQGQSGLGLEAQAAAIKTYVSRVGGHIVATFTEVESGKVDARPQLQEALQLARVTGATLAIAKLDRLSRNAAFLLTLKDSGVKFIAADMPEDIAAVVSRGGRPDLTGCETLARVRTPTLLIVGGDDVGVIELNEKARRAMVNCICEMTVVPGATHLFEESGKLEQVATLAGEWFTRFMQTELVESR